MRNNKIVQLHYTLVSQGFHKEAAEVIKLAAKPDFYRDLIDEARFNINKSSSTEFKSQIGSLTAVTSAEMKSILSQLGCAEVSSSGQNTDHYKFQYQNTKTLNELLNDGEILQKIPEIAIEYFKRRSEIYPAAFFTIQKGKESSIPANTLLGNFWKFAKVEAAAKVILDDYVNRAELKDPSKSEFSGLTSSFNELISLRESVSQRINELLESLSSEELDGNEELMRLEEEESRLDQSIRNFWST